MFQGLLPEIKQVLAMSDLEDAMAEAGVLDRLNLFRALNNHVLRPLQAPACPMGSGSSIGRRRRVWEEQSPSVEGLTIAIGHVSSC